MDINISSSHSSDVAIYLEIEGQIIRIGELLRNEGTLLDLAEVPPNTIANLVVEIDGDKRSERVLLHNGINPSSNRISFSYPLEHAGPVPF